MGHGLRDIRKNCAIQSLLATAVRCTKEDDPKCGITDGLILRL